MSAPAIPLRMNRFTASVPEIAHAVLVQVDADMPGGTRWNRAADLAWLGTELARRIELAECGAAPTPADTARLAAYFRAAVQRGVPLPEMQRFTRACVVHSFTELWARAEPEDVTELLRLCRWTGRHNGAVERLLVQVYCERLDPARAGAVRREARAERLLAGVTDAGPMPAARCWLVAVLGGPVEATDLHASLPGGALTAVLDGRRHVVVPIWSASRRTDAWSALAAWVAGQGGLRAAGSFCNTVPDIPEGATVARRLLRAATAVALPDGLVGPRDLALESALTGRPDATAALAGLLDVLGADERLVETLVAFFGNDLDRTRTAAALYLSRGGLSLRLDRIAQLTGLDPRTTRGIQVLGSALTARALRDVDEA